MSGRRVWIQKEAALSRISARDDGTLRILQVTDFHSDTDAALRQRTFDDVRVLVTETDPDLLAVTGDIWCADDKPGIALDLMSADLADLGSLDVPWAFAWGNHDYVVDLPASMAAIAAAPNAITPAGARTGAYRIEVVDPFDFEPLWDIMMLNSGAAWSLPNDTDWFEAESKRLASERGDVRPALVFVHIPLEEYETARLAGTYQGIALEEVRMGGDGRVFESFKRAGNVRACFVGHSHVNDFHCDVDGIILAYGRATGHGGYGADRLRKGAKLITLDTRNDKIHFETVFPNGER